MRRKVLVVDIDGVITIDTSGSYAARREDVQVIRDLTMMRKKGWRVVLWTARPESARRVTVNWLKAKSVRYEKLLMGKPRADAYVDDKAMTQQELRRLAR